MAELETSVGALREGEAHLRLALTAAQVGMWELDLRSNRLVWSREVASLFGLPPESFAGTFEAYLELVHPADQPAVSAAIARALDHDQPFYIEH